MYKDILLPVDLGNLETQDKAVSTAIDLAKTYGSRLHVMTIIPDFGESFVASYFPADYQEKAIGAASEKLHDFVRQRIPEGIQVQHIVAHGTIYDEILSFAKEHPIDMIVMASHRPALQDYLLGPNASHVVRHSNCSVLVVRN